MTTVTRPMPDTSSSRAPAGTLPGLDPQASTLLASLSQWAESGWLRRLDTALARFVAEQCPTAASPVLLATALLAHLEGRGHTCLPLDELLAAPDDLLGWDTPARDALHEALASQPDHIDAWLQVLQGCAAVWRPEIDADRGQPLVLSGRRLYLRRYWDYESRVVAQVRARTADLEPIDDAVARLWLDRLFDPLPGAAVAQPPDVRAPDGAGTPSTVVGAPAVAPDWQKIACAVALRGRLSVITGGPGTGKTYTAARLLALLFAVAPDRTRLRVALAAPTGKAAARLKQSIDSALQGLQQRVGAELDIAELARRVGAA
ncbi:MAG: exodeoxyribonuclease subunit alpha, partial [Pseudomonadota bacterium]